MSEDNETRQEHNIIEERAYQGDRPTPTADEVTDAGSETGINLSYKGQRPEPTPVSEKPSNENTSDES